MATVSDRQFQGFSIVSTPTTDESRTNPIDGVAWEFTAQAIIAMRLVDSLYSEANYAASVVNYLNQIREAQLFAPFGDSKGVVASTLNNGDQLSPIDQCLNVPFQCIPERVSLAATVWAIFADLGIKVWLMLNSRVLFDQQLNQSVKQGFSSFPDIMDELEKTKIERKLFL